MKIFVAGAAGVLGRRLIPMLLNAGHEVTGTTRTEHTIPMLQHLGAKAVLTNVFDRERLISHLRDIRPEVIIHLLTDLRDGDIEANARIRRVGTRNLIDAALAAGVEQVIAQSIAWAYEPGVGPADEKVPLDSGAPMPRRITVEGVQALEEVVSEMNQWTILRYGMLYGPGTWYAEHGKIAEQVRAGEVQADEGVTSFVHVDDAARAALQALTWPIGVVNIVDDEPAAGTTWLPVYANALGAPIPQSVSTKPQWARGARNTKARRQLNWEPKYPNWRKGFFASTQTKSTQSDKR